MSWFRTATGKSDLTSLHVMRRLLAAGFAGRWARAVLYCTVLYYTVLYWARALLLELAPSSIRLYAGQTRD